MKTDVFISYRRDGGENLAQLIYFQLTNDGYSVFLDVESLRAGKFNEALYGKIEECTDFVLILPPKALARCKNEGDWLRLEIAHAIKHKKNIIPLIMPDFKFPPKEKLPEEIRDVGDYHGVETHRRYFQSMIAELEEKFLQSSKHGGRGAQGGEAAPRFVVEEDAQSLIYVKDYFRCPECGARKICRQDGLDSRLMFLDAVSGFMIWLSKALLCAALIFAISVAAFSPEGRELARDFFSQVPLLEHLLNTYDSVFMQWLTLIATLTILPGSIIMLVKEAVDEIHRKIWKKELYEGPHTVRCRCRNCRTRFLAVSSEKALEDWTPNEDEE